MQKKQPTQQDIVDALKLIAAASPDKRVSRRIFKDETGWDPDYWCNKHWPARGYQGACEDAGVQSGVAVDINTRIADQEIAEKFADTVKELGGIPSCHRFCAMKRLARQTILRNEKYPAAKRRLISAYFALPPEKRDGKVEEILRKELLQLEGKTAITPLSASESTAQQIHHEAHISNEYLVLVREMRDHGEEEQRQLVAQIFTEILGYKRRRVKSEHKHNDIRVHDRKDRPWLVVEVKASLSNEREQKQARRQGFDYAHRCGMRFVVLSDGDYYEIYDRCAGERLSYDEMKQGSFKLSSLRQRDNDLISLLAAER